MLRTLILLMISGSLSIMIAQSFTDFVNNINSLPVSDRQAKADSFLNVPRTYPVTENTKAHFIWAGSTSGAAVAGDFNGWNSSNGPMTNIQGTNIWYRTETFPTDARMDYKFVINGSWILDPRNSHTVSGGYGPNSELAMPAYVQPWEIKYKENILHGTRQWTSITSSIMNRTYQLAIYLPPTYEKEALRRFPSVYFQDGGEYQSLGSAVNVIDNLIDSNKIDPVIAVFVTPTNRNNEYAEGNRHNYRLFFVNELVPFIDSVYRTIKDPQKRLVLGDSFGGNISALISYYHPGVFANCGQQSGAFWPNNYEASNLFVSGPYKNIKIHSVWGSYEGSLTQNWRMAMDSLKAKGYRISGKERPEGHSWGLWRAHLDDMLIYFFPAGSTSGVFGAADVPASFELRQNYPNPFNPETNISYTISRDAFVKLEIFDLLGRSVQSLVNRWQSAGTYSIRFSGSRFSSGSYIYRLNAGGNTVSKKMTIIK